MCPAKSVTEPEDTYLQDEDESAEATPVTPRKLKARIDAIEEDLAEAELAMDSITNRLSQAVFDLREALNGKPFEDERTGAVCMFAQNKKTGRHYLIHRGGKELPKL
jgi:hypothetical protein